MPEGIKARTDRRTRTELGQAGLAAVQANLWAEDCQTCGKPLGGDPPSLVVHDLAGTAWAGLHHPACQSPRWDDGAAGVYLVHHGGATLTVRTCAVLLPEPKRLGRITHWPVALVNPSLEQISLRRTDEGWQVATMARYAELGFTPAPDLVPNTRAVPHAAADLTGDLLTITAAGQTWEVNTMPALGTRARKLGGLLAGVTTALEPGQLYRDPAASRRLMEAIHAGHIAFGWIPLAP